MKLALSCCTLVFLLLGISTTASADVARPKPSPQEPRVVFHTGLEIVPDGKLYEAKLQIRQSDLQQLRAALDGAAGNRSLATTITRSSTRTIIAGLMLFLSVSLGGVWLARSIRSRAALGRGQKAIAVVLLAAATLGAAAIITQGNAGPPGYYRWRNLSQNLANGTATTGGLDIEIVPDDPNSGGMKLLIPIRK